MGQKSSKAKTKQHGDSRAAVAVSSSNAQRKPTHLNRRDEETTEEGSPTAAPAQAAVGPSHMQRNIGHLGRALPEPTLEKVQEQDVSSSTASTTSVPFQFMPLTEYDAIVTRSDNIHDADLKSQEVSTSMTGFLDDDSSAHICSSACQQQHGKAEMIDVKTSTPTVSPCFCPETVFYHKSQHVGCETRHAEFKKGGVIFDQRSFRSLIGRYLCAFLNTEGGVIYFGVTDDGKVVGVKVNQKTEDELRLSIDTVVSSILPNVSTSAYAINFANVMNDEGQFERNLKVMEICVHPRNPPRTLHAFDGNKYVRRDGSLRTV